MAVNNQHGLSFKVVVNNPDYLPTKMNRFLSQFRMFHGPLNEVTIIGCSDPAFARAIETSISAPRNASHQLTWNGFTILIVQRTKAATDLIANSEGWMFAYIVNDLLSEMYRNALTYDVTAWTGSIETNWLSRPFQMLEVAISYLNLTYAGFVSVREELYSNTNEATTAKPATICREMRRFNFSDIVPQLESWRNLLADLHCIFNVRIENDDAAQTQHSILVRHGLDLMNHLSAGDTELFRKASEMSARLPWLDLAPNKAAMLQGLDTFCEDIAGFFLEQRRFSKWAVHVSLLPNELLARGVLDHMTECSTMSDEDNKRFVRQLRLPFFFPRFHLVSYLNFAPAYLAC